MSTEPSNALKEEPAMWIVTEYGGMINTDHVRLIGIVKADDGDYFQIKAFYPKAGAGTMIISSNQVSCARIFKALVDQMETGTSDFIRVERITSKLGQEGKV